MLFPQRIVKPKYYSIIPFQAGAAILSLFFVCTTFARAGGPSALSQARWNLLGVKAPRPAYLEACAGNLEGLSASLTSKYSNGSISFTIAEGEKLRQYFLSKGGISAVVAQVSAPYRSAPQILDLPNWRSGLLRIFARPDPEVERRMQALVHNVFTLPEVTPENLRRAKLGANSMGTLLAGAGLKFLAYLDATFVFANHPITLLLIPASGAGVYFFTKLGKRIGVQSLNNQAFTQLAVTHWQVFLNAALADVDPEIRNQVTIPLQVVLQTSSESEPNL